MLEISDVTVSFGEKKVLRHCSLSLGQGEKIALMSPSGCGKTTLLRVALGLQVPDEGSVRRSFARCAAVFQEPRLMPWLTAEENVNAVLSDTPATLTEARRWLEKVELGTSEALYPSELSGGMQQRVALARALAVSPEMLVLDEPFKGMDASLRLRMIRLIREALPDASLLLATHSEEEALELGCRIFRFQEGQFISA